MMRGVPTPGPAPDAPSVTRPSPAPVTPSHARPRSRCRPVTALGRGLRHHPDDGLVVLRAIRDDDGVVRDLRHEWVNEAADRNAGRPLLGTNLLETYGSDATLFPTMCELLGTGTWQRRRMTFDAATRDTFLHSRVFEVYLADAGDDCVTCQYRDVTDLHRARALLEHQAAHDELTGVPNRRRLVEHLDRSCSTSRPAARPCWSCSPTSTASSRSTTSYGHPRGTACCARPQSGCTRAMRAGDVVARYGGDEFVVVCLDVPDEAEAQVLANASTPRSPAPTGWTSGPRWRWACPSASRSRTTRSRRASCSTGPTGRSTRSSAAAAGPARIAASR